MKKILLLMVAAIVGISAMGQPVTKKAQIIGFQRLLDLENLQSLLVTDLKLDTTISETWDETGGKWIFSTRKRYAYSEVGLTKTATASKRDLSTSFLWVNSGKTETTIDALGNTTSIVDYTWNKTTSLWIGSMKIEYSFSNGKLASNSTYTYNTGTGLWDGLIRTEYTYTSGNLTQDIRYNWDETLPIPNWVNSTKTVYTYTGGVLTSDLSYGWDEVASNWGVASGKTEYTYSGGNMASATSSVWDINTSAWVYSSKSVYTYTGGKQTAYIVSSWIGGIWVNASKMESEFNDPAGRITLYSYYGWNVGTNQWYGYLKNVTSYGVLGPLSYSITVGSGWDLINSQWSTQSRSTNWYSDIVTGINKISERNLSVYPNPVKDFIVFDIDNISESATVMIFDIQGKKVLEQQISGNMQIAVSKLRKGLYIYKLYNNGITFSGKILKD